jgi:RNA polymerase sigma factor (sigma-70 family)
VPTSGEPLTQCAHFPAVAGHSVESDGHEDQQDIRASLKGDGDAYARLVRRHQTWVAARMWKFTRNSGDHEELVQEVFVQAYLSLAGFRGEGPFTGWLSRIATRVGYAHWKTRSRECSARSVPIEALDELAAMQAEEIDAELAGRTLCALLDRLPPRDRLVLMLRYVEDRSVEETAAVTGWGATMVKVQSWRARNKLRKLMKEAGVEVEP